MSQFNKMIVSGHFIHCLYRKYHFIFDIKEIVKNPEIQSESILNNETKRRKSNVYNDLNISTSPKIPRKYDSKKGLEDEIIGTNKFTNYENIKKYFKKRYVLFKRYDEGIKLDDESWYSVTPEKIAKQTADIVGKLGPNLTVLDGFCGAGGNTIQFGLHPNISKIIAVDIDSNKLKMTKHNCKVYNVNLAKIEFKHHNLIQFLINYSKCKTIDNKIDIIFLSPPWGGTSYKYKSKTKFFDIECDLGNEINGIKLFNLCKKISKNIIYYLPKNCDYNRLKWLGYSDKKRDCIYGWIMKNKIGNCVKAISVYYGQLRNIAKFEDKKDEIFESKNILNDF